MNLITAILRSPRIVTGRCLSASLSRSTKVIQQVAAIFLIVQEMIEGKSEKSCGEDFSFLT
jgi:hypothetical protein